VAAAVTPGADAATLDIGSGELVTVRAVVEHLRQLVGGSIVPIFGALLIEGSSASVSPSP
jgi:hypothetical protein